ncbi:MAG: GTP cyclohydrolase, FolE2/MptA family [Methanoregula sp.]|nr:GTP cyclohydrolase, FolE2/MptA family [Methanoregula sp.]
MTRNFRDTAWGKAGGYVTAHKNPGFVEDCIREMAMTVLAEFDYLSRYSVTIKQTTVESIHQHNVFAERRATLVESISD